MDFSVQLRVVGGTYCDVIQVWIDGRLCGKLCGGESMRERFLLPTGEHTLQCILTNCDRLRYPNIRHELSPVVVREESALVLVLGPPEDGGWLVFE